MPFQKGEVAMEDEKITYNRGPQEHPIVNRVVKVQLYLIVLGYFLGICLSITRFWYVGAGMMGAEICISIEYYFHYYYKTVRE
jgi:hypothetical protein